MIKINEDIYRSNEIIDIRNKIINKAKENLSQSPKLLLKKTVRGLKIIKKNKNGSISKLIKDIIEYDEAQIYYETNYHFKEYIQLSRLLSEAKSLYPQKNKAQREEYIVRLLQYINSTGDNILRIRNDLVIEMSDLEIFKQRNLIKRKDFNDLILKIFKNLEELNDSAKLTFSYTKLIKPYRNEIIEKMGIKACPYCNIYNLDTTTKKKTADLDHFFVQSLMPIFAATISNFIPSCPACNRTFKGTWIKEISNPKVEEYGDIAKFKVNFIDNIIPIFDYKDIDKIKISIEFNEESPYYQRIKASIDLFEILGRYNHEAPKSEVGKLVKSLRQEFNESRRKMLKDTLGVSNSITEDELLSTILFFDIRGDFLNIPYAKLKNDIIHELTDWR